MKKNIAKKGFKNWFIQFGVFWFVVVYGCMKLYAIVENGLAYEFMPLLLIKEILVWLVATFILSWLIWKFIVQSTKYNR